MTRKGLTAVVVGGLIVGLLLSYVSGYLGATVATMAGPSSSSS